MVRDTAELHRHLYDAFDDVLRKHLGPLPEEQRESEAARLRAAFALALENAPSRTDVVADLHARATIAAVVSSVFRDVGEAEKA